MTVFQYGMLFIGLGLLASCSEDPQGDFRDCQEGELTMELNIVEDVQAAYEEQFGSDRGSPLQGFTVLNDGAPQVYISLPSGKQDREGIYVAGHEFLHAACGTWHGESEHY